MGAVTPCWQLPRTLPGPRYVPGPYHATPLAHPVARLSRAERRAPIRWASTGGSARNDWAALGGELVLSPLPHSYLSPADVPPEFSWADKDGRSWLTLTRNQVYGLGISVFSQGGRPFEAFPIQCQAWLVTLTLSK